MSSPLSRSLLINTIWSFVGRFGYLAVGLASNIVLARMLSPTEFGQVAIMMFFVILASILIESGLSGALVRKQNIEEVDYSTVFIFNMVVSLALMALLMASADYIAKFYEDLALSAILKAASLVLVVNALRVTQTVRLVKELRFKAKAGYEFVAISVASLVAIFLAARGAGVWSLVALQLSTSLMLTALLWFRVGPLKSFKFSKKSFSGFYKFGINTTLASLLNSAFDNIYQLILAKYFSIQQSGYFYQAKKLQEMPVGVLQSAALGVVYSTLSKLQDLPEEFDSLYRNSIKIFTIAVAAICMLMYCYADLIIELLYGPKWSGSVIYMKFLAVAAFFYLQEIFNRVIFKVFDRTELILRLEIFKKTVQSVTIIYGVLTMDIDVLLYGFVAVSIFSFLVNYFYARKVQGRFAWVDFLAVIKISFSAAVVVVITEVAFESYSIDGPISLLALPVMLSLFVVLLHYSHVIDFHVDLKHFLLLYRGGDVK